MRLHRPKRALFAQQIQHDTGDESSDVIDAEVGRAGSFDNKSGTVVAAK